MFEFTKGSAVKPKIHATHGLLPRHVDRDQLPSSKQPFSTILNQQWSHTIDLLLPKDLYDEHWTLAEQTLEKCRYSKVFMSLKQLLEGDFFNVYIKAGNISMLSEGRAGIDCLYSLREGILRLELPKDKYERAGLVGEPVPDGGRRHIKTRYAVELNLRQPSMVRGRKAFDRLIRACENVLNESLTWLFIDHNLKQTLEKETIPISIHQPTENIVNPSIRTHAQTRMLPLENLGGTVPIDEEDSVELLEWIGMLSLDSPRLQSSDDIDSFLSRYGKEMGEHNPAMDLVTIRWHGFVDATFVRLLFVEMLPMILKAHGAWFALSAYGFNTQAVNADNGYTILRLPAQTSSGDNIDIESRTDQPEYLSWQMSSTVNHQ